MKKCRNCLYPEKVKEFQERVAFLEKENVVDFLTGVYNRRGITKLLEDEIERIGRYGDPFCVILADVDNLKDFNNIGFLTGDYVLKRIAESISRGVRKIDKVGRLGGDEFIVLCSGIKIREALELAERLRKSISSSPVNYEGRKLKLSISLGAAEIRKKETNLSDILKKADEALKKSKREGKNKITHF